MATLSPLQILCPACGETIALLLSSASGEQQGDSVTMAVTVDRRPIREHAEQHAAAPDWLVPSLYESGEA